MQIPTLKKSYLLIATVLIGLNAQANEWQPVEVEQLIELPVNLIEKRIQQDFNLSPMASKLSHIETALVSQGEKIKALQAIVQEAKDNEMIDEKVNLVKVKSDFLDNMQEGQLLRQKSLSQKIDLYQAVLEKLYQQQNRQQSSALYQVKQQQEAARERMEKVMAKVDAAMYEQGLTQTTPYADEFTKNLAKINKLKEAIQSHKANMSPMVNGIEVSTEEYVRQLLMQVASEQSLLDQEALMLSYMSRLVALDAQALEYAINIEDEDASGSKIESTTTPATSVSLFL